MMRSHTPHDAPRRRNADRKPPQRRSQATPCRLTPLQRRPRADLKLLQRRRNAVPTPHRRRPDAARMPPPPGPSPPQRRQGVGERRTATRGPASLFVGTWAKGQLAAGDLFWGGEVGGFCCVLL